MARMADLIRRYRHRLPDSDRGCFLPRLQTLVTIRGSKDCSAKHPSDVDPVALGELDKALGLDLDADVGELALMVGGDASPPGGGNGNYTSFCTREFIGVLVEPTHALDDEVNFLIPLVGMDEGHTDASGQFIECDFRACEVKLIFA